MTCHHGYCSLQVTGDCDEAGTFCDFTKMVTLLTLESVGTEDSSVILKQLQALTKLCQDEEQRVTLDVENFKAASALLDRLVGESSFARDDELVEMYRFLRNSVVACSKNQDLIRNQTNLINVTQSFLENRCACIIAERNAKDDNGNLGEKTGYSDNYLVAIRCSLQFLANMMVDNKENSSLISSLLPATLGELIMTLEDDDKVIQYGAMIVHLGLKHSSKNFWEPKIIKTLLKKLELEFVVYSMETLVTSEEFVEVFESLDTEARIKMLSFLNSRHDLLKSISPKAVEVLTASFNERSDFILKSKVEDHGNLFCWEIAILLEVLCTLSAETKVLQSDSSLVTTVLYLLKGVHEAGKDSPSSGSVFAPVEDLAKLTSNSKESDVNDIRAHPTFLFKAHLIRLIANLSHRNKANQDKVRDLDCIPIILDNCKLDARNPFIGQWSVLAIRNLCEGNEEIQAYIREVQRVDTEKLLPKLELIDISK